MSLDTDVETLQAQHQDLEQQIVRELGRPVPDELRIQELRRQKLRLKDQMAQLARIPA